jgi:hypothetical protein
MAETKQQKTPKGGKGDAPQKSGKGGKGDKVATLAVDPAPKVAEGKPRLQAYYESTVRGRLQKQFGLKNPNQTPRLTKIVLNVGMGDAPGAGPAAGSVVSG